MSPDHAHRWRALRTWFEDLPPYDQELLLLVVEQVVQRISRRSASAFAAWMDDLFLLLDRFHKAAMMPKKPSGDPTRLLTPPNGEAPLSDLDFVDELDNLLLRLRGICKVVKWTTPEALNDPTNPLAHTMEVVTDLLDKAIALADRWYHARYPDGRQQASRGKS